MHDEGRVCIMGEGGHGMEWEYWISGKLDRCLLMNVCISAGTVIDM